MKIKEGYILREVAGNSIVVPVGGIDFDGVISLNETGVFIWKLIGSGASEKEIVSKITKEYDIDENTASKDASRFISLLREKNIIDE